MVDIVFISNSDCCVHLYTSDEKTIVSDQVIALAPFYESSQISIFSHVIKTKL